MADDHVFKSVEDLSQATSTPLMADSLGAAWDEYDYLIEHGRFGKTTAHGRAVVEAAVREPLEQRIEELIWQFEYLPGRLAAAEATVADLRDAITTVELLWVTNEIHTVPEVFNRLHALAQVEGRNG